MSKAQGDGYRTWTNVELNKQVANSHDATASKTALTVPS